MPRKGHIPKRDVLPDPIYNDKVVTKLVNNIMQDGKKGVAQKICYDAFDLIKEKTGKDPLEVFEQALNNIHCKTTVKQLPLPGRLSTVTAPPCRAAIFCAMARPKPLPCVRWLVSP